MLFGLASKITAGKTAQEELEKLVKKKHKVIKKYLDISKEHLDKCKVIPVNGTYIKLWYNIDTVVLYHSNYKQYTYIVPISLLEE